MAIILLMSDEFFMKLALDEAWKYQLLTYPNPAVGCAIVDKNGKLLALGAHKCAGLAHAELGAVALALCELKPELKSELLRLKNNPNELYDFILKNHKGALNGACAFVSLEPCTHFGKTPPCALLLRDLGFCRVVFGSADLGGQAKGGAKLLANAGVSVAQSTLKSKCDELLEPFLAWQSGHFAFFKLALSLNGVYTGKISSQIAQKHCHDLRSKLDLLVIGGNTVRSDRPILDARFSATKHAPDVLIYSRKSEFDGQIPLFSVLNRKVDIKSDLELLKKAKFAMIEGAGTLFKALENEFSWVLIYQSKSFKKGSFLDISKSLEIMHSTPLGPDTALWCKVREN